MEKLLNLHIDESGDFGELEGKSKYYLLVIVMHAQSIPVDDHVKKLNEELSQINFPEHIFHAGPMIGGREKYYGMEIEQRKALFSKINHFSLKSPVQYHTIIVERGSLSAQDLIYEIENQLECFLHDNFQFFLSFNTIRVHYDNGQEQIRSILLDAFDKVLPNYKYIEAAPSKYRLLQSADFFCTMELINRKILNNEMSRSERIFFGDARNFKKNYYKKITKKKFR